jgi:hypothetical protein
MFKNSFGKATKHDPKGHQAKKNQVSRAMMRTGGAIFRCKPTGRADRGVDFNGAERLTSGLPCGCGLKRSKSKIIGVLLL